MINIKFYELPFGKYGVTGVVECMTGQTIIYVKKDDDVLYFLMSDGGIYRLQHFQSCCENVYIESIVGDLNDLIGNPLLISEEVSNKSLPPVDESDESYTWTFYKFATIKGYVDIRFYGSSNGCYSETVDFQKLEDGRDLERISGIEKKVFENLIGKFGLSKEKAKKL